MNQDALFDLLLSGAFVTDMLYMHCRLKTTTFRDIAGVRPKQSMYRRHDEPAWCKHDTQVNCAVWNVVHRGLLSKVKKQHFQGL